MHGNQKEKFKGTLHQIFSDFLVIPFLCFLLISLHFLEKKKLLGKHLYSGWVQNGPPNATYDKNDSGWMESAQFTRWFKFSFLEHVKKLSGHKILFLDGHSSHLSLELVDLARDNNVI